MNKKMPILMSMIMAALAATSLWSGNAVGVVCGGVGVLFGAWSYRREQLWTRRVRVMGAILLGARTRLPGKAMKLSTEAYVYEVDSLFISIEQEGTGYQRQLVRVSVSGAPYGVSVATRGIVGRADGLQTGDLAFDLAVRVEGPRLETIARLDAPARATLREALDGGSMTGGVWSIDLDPLRYATIEAAVDDALAWVHRFLAAARIWLAPSTPAANLANMVRTDPKPGVRVRALLLLATIDPSLAVARELVGTDGLASTELERLVAAALIAQVEGTGADMPALHAAAARLGASPEREAVELAIEAIRARVGSAQVGALSLGVLGGELSAPVERGRTGELSAPADGGELARAEARDRGGPP